MKFKKSKRENGYKLENESGFILVEYNYNFGKKEISVFAEHISGLQRSFSKVSDAKSFIEFGC